MRRKPKIRRNFLRKLMGVEPLESRRLLTCDFNDTLGDPNDQICDLDFQQVLTTGNFEDRSIGTGGLGGLDVDLYPFEIVKTGIEHMFTADNRNGSSVDTYLRLFDASGTELDDDEIDEAITGLQNGPAVGSIDPDTDVDVYRFDAVGGQTFRIDVDGVTPLDTFLVIFDGNGNQLAADDDAGPGFDAQLTATFPTTDDYYFGVSNTGNRNYDPNNGTGDIAGSATGTLGASRVRDQ